MFAFGGPLADAIRRFKFGRMPALGRTLASLLREDEELTDKEALERRLIVPVPLHYRRLRQREFNPASLLVLAAPLTGIRAFDALSRVRDTPPQTALSGRARQNNVRDAFVGRRDRVRGRSVLLIDDVMTTGATVEACTRALRQAGAIEVSVLTMARAVP